MPYESDPNLPDPGDTPIPSSVIGEANLQYQRSQEWFPKLPRDFEQHTPFMFERSSSPPPRGQKRARTESPDSSRTLKREPEPKSELGSEETCRAMEELAPKLNRLKGRVFKLSKKVEADQGAQRRYAVWLCEGLRDDMNEQLEMMIDRVVEVEKHQIRVQKDEGIRARLEKVEKGLEELKGSLTELQAEEDEHEIFIAYEYKPEIERINTTLEDVKVDGINNWEEIFDVRKQIDGVDAIVDHVDSKTERLDTEVASLAATNAELKAELAELKSGYQVLKACMDDLKGSLGGWIG